MPRLAAILICLLAFTSVGVADGSASQADKYEFLREIVASDSSPSLLLEAQPAATYAECCKVCTKGKPCGDTCIAQDKICHVGPGCAC